MSHHGRHHIQTLAHLQAKFTREYEESPSVNVRLCKTGLLFSPREQHCSLKNALKTDWIDRQNALQLLDHSELACTFLLSSFFLVRYPNILYSQQACQVF